MGVFRRTRLKTLLYVTVTQEAELSYKCNKKWYFPSTSLASRCVNPGAIPKLSNTNTFPLWWYQHSVLHHHWHRRASNLWLVIIQGLAPQHSQLQELFLCPHLSLSLKQKLNPRNQLQTTDIFQLLHPLSTDRDVYIFLYVLSEISVALASEITINLSFLKQENLSMDKLIIHNLESEIFYSFWLKPYHI